MTNFIDDLKRKLKDAQFQADRLLKRQPLDRQFLLQLAELTKEIKSDLMSLESTSAVGGLIHELSVLNPDYQPTISSFRRIFGFITFGWSINRYILRAQRDYTISTVKQLNGHYAYLERHLSEL